MRASEKANSSAATPSNSMSAKARRASRGWPPREEDPMRAFQRKRRWSVRGREKKRRRARRRRGG